MFAFLGAGAILGALAAPTVARRVPAKFVIVGSLWLWAVYPLVLVVLPNALAIGLVAGVVNITGPIFNVVLSAYRYALVPDRLLGRVGSVILLVAWGTIPLGAISAVSSKAVASRCMGVQPRRSSVVPGRDLQSA